MLSHHNGSRQNTSPQPREPRGWPEVWPLAVQRAAAAAGAAAWPSQRHGTPPSFQGSVRGPGPLRICAAASATRVRRSDVGCTGQGSSPPPVGVPVSPRRPDAAAGAGRTRLRALTTGKSVPDFTARGIETIPARTSRECAPMGQESSCFNNHVECQCQHGQHSYQRRYEP